MTRQQAWNYMQTLIPTRLSDRQQQQMGHALYLIDCLSIRHTHTHTSCNQRMWEMSTAYFKHHMHHLAKVQSSKNFFEKRYADPRWEALGHASPQCLMWTTSCRCRELFVLPFCWSRVCDVCKSSSSGIFQEHNAPWHPCFDTETHQTEKVCARGACKSKRHITIARVAFIHLAYLPAHFLCPKQITDAVTATLPELLLRQSDSVHCTKSSMARKVTDKRMHRNWSWTLACMLKAPVLIGLRWAWVRSHFMTNTHTSPCLLQIVCMHYRCGEPRLLYWEGWWLNLVFLSQDCSEHQTGKITKSEVTNNKDGFAHCSKETTIATNLTYDVGNCGWSLSRGMGMHWFSGREGHAFCIIRLRIMSVAGDVMCLL